jgi:hypothetical protein
MSMETSGPAASEEAPPVTGPKVIDAVIDVDPAPAVGRRAAAGPPPPLLTRAARQVTRVARFVYRLLTEVP